MFNKHLIVILGPTAVGKTKLSLHLAKKYKTEIISADSRQVYKELNIGVAKPSAKELKEIKHHFVGTISVYENFNAGIFEAEALKCLQNLFYKNDVVILTGGTGLFINAVCYGFDKLPSADEKIRKNLNDLYDKEGIIPLQTQLKKIDPVYYNQVDIFNPRRLIRAIEISLITGKPYSSLTIHKPAKRNFLIHKIGLHLERKELYTRINSRVETMFNEGLIKEVKSLWNARNLTALQTIGYKEIFDYLNDNLTFDEAIHLIKVNSRRYAKRQLTWFRKDKSIKWFNPDDFQKINECLNL